MRNLRGFHMGRLKLIFIGGFLALESESHRQKRKRRSLLGSGFPSEFLLAKGYNTIAPHFIQYPLQKRRGRVLLSGSSIADPMRDETSRLQLLFEKQRKEFGEDSEITLTSMNTYAAHLMEIGDFGKAQGLLEDLCGLGRTSLERGHAQILLGLTNLARIFIEAGGEFSPLRLAEAARLKKEVSEMKSDTIGRLHPETLKAAEDYLSTLARIADIEGELDEDDFLRLGFEESTFGEVMRDYLDTCDLGVLTGKVVLTKDVLKAKRNSADASERKKRTSLVKRPLQAISNILQNFRRK